MAKVVFGCGAYCRQLVLACGPGYVVPCDGGEVVGVGGQSLPDGKVKDLAEAAAFAADAGEFEEGLAGDGLGQVGELEAPASPIVAPAGRQLLQPDKLEDAHLVGEVQTLGVEHQMTGRFSATEGEL